MPIKPEPHTYADTAAAAEQVAVNDLLILISYLSGDCTLADALAAARCDPALFTERLRLARAAGMMLLETQAWRAANFPGMCGGYHTGPGPA